MGGVSPRSFERSMRSLLGKQLSLPTLRVDQWISFAPLPANAARILGLKAGQPGFVMELRGYTLRDQPLSYQSAVPGRFPSGLSSYSSSQTLWMTEKLGILPP